MAKSGPQAEERLRIDHVRFRPKIEFKLSRYSFKFPAERQAAVRVSLHRRRIGVLSILTTVRDIQLSVRDERKVERGEFAVNQGLEPGTRPGGGPPPASNHYTVSFRNSQYFEMIAVRRRHSTRRSSSIHLTTRARTSRTRATINSSHRRSSNKVIPRFIARVSSTLAPPAAPAGFDFAAAEARIAHLRQVR